jgi:hypothetical protein
MQQSRGRVVQSGATPRRPAGSSIAKIVQIYVSFDFMKTTLDLKDDLLVRAKEAAARERTTLTRMVEEGLALRLRRRPASAARNLPPLPVSVRRGGLSEGIDGSSNRSLLDAADE